MKSARTLRVAFWLAISAMAVFAMAASSPQCARSTDNVVSPGLETLASPDPVKQCRQDCDAAARVAIREERTRHRNAGKACNGDDQCHAEEDALHDSILAEIESDKQSCYVNCEHTQGGGSGGQ